MIVAIDDKSLLALGAWPWSRDLLAETTKQLTRGGPRIIGYNLPLDGAQVSAGIGSLGDLRKILKQENKLSQRVNRALRITELNLQVDNKLAASFKAAGRVVLAMPYIEGTGVRERIDASITRLHGAVFAAQG